jgi:hypothetical protein
MSVFRPEAMQEVKRWLEPLFLALSLPLAAYWLWLGLTRPSYFYLGLGALLALVAGPLLYFALIRLKLRRTGAAAGIVEVRERSIVYFAPHLGGEVSLEGLSKIVISPRKSGSYNWVLYAPEQRPLIIPFNAKGADRLLHAFSALPGLSLERLNKALKADGNVMHIVWHRPH